MSPVYSARKRADEFDALVSGAAEAAPAGRHAELLDVVGALRSVAPVQARPDFVSSLRSQLMEAAAVELTPVTSAAVVDRLTVPQRRTARDRRLAAAIGGLAIVGASTSMAVAAQSALPGDMLYPLKRVIENAHTTVSLGEDHKGTTLLHNAAGRLEEVDALARTREADADAISATLEDFSDQASQASDLLLATYAEGGDPSSVLELRSFAATSLSMLDQLASEIPDGARPALVDAANVLAGIDAAAHRACPTCDGAGISRFPTWMLTSSSTADLVKGRGLDSGASVTKIERKHQHRGDQPTVSPTPILEPGTDGLLTPPTSGSGSTGSPSSPSSDDPLTQLGNSLLGNGGTSTGAASDDDDVLTGVLDGVSELLDPDGDGVLGGTPPSSGK